jgi:hypothetical protein
MTPEAPAADLKPKQNPLRISRFKRNPSNRNLKKSLPIRPFHEIKDLNNHLREFPNGWFFI